MNQAIVIFIKNKEIGKIRKKHDSRYKKFKSHLSLVYPFKDINQKQLNKHIKNSIKKIKPFKIVFKGLKKSAKEYYLYLLINQGNLKIKKIYKNLNSGILSEFKNKDLPKYIPHISLGVFKTKKQIDAALKEIKKENLKVEYMIKEIHLITLNKNHGLKSIKNFKIPN